MKETPRVLECHSKGDTRYSPFFCWIEAFGVRDTIESHYQKSKVFIRQETGELVSPANWREAKFYQTQPPKGIGLPRWPEFILPNGIYVPIQFHVFGWYAGLWLKYLDANSELVEEAKTYDEYRDPFKGSFPLCQADCIRLYCKSGREALLDKCKEFFEWLKNNRI